MAKNKTEDNITKALKWASTLVGASQSLYDSVKEYPSSIELRKLLRFVRASEEEYTALVKKYPRILQRLFYIQDTMGHFAYEDLTSDLNVATMLEMWNRNKQIYTFDSDFLNELLETENFSMTKNAWDYLPYDTFYIDISQNETLYNMFGYGMFIKVEKDIELERYAVYICRITENLYFGDSFPISNDDYEEVIDKTITKEIPTFADPVKDDKNKSYIFQQNGTWQINDGLYKSIIMQILTPKRARLRSVPIVSQLRTVPRKISFPRYRCGMSERTSAFLTVNGKRNGSRVHMRATARAEGRE